MPEIRSGAQAVRGSLETLEAGDEARALDLLRDIPRSSPFADWRYFVRGLAAHRRGDSEQVAANWDRLDERRAAARIARFLRGRDGEGPDGRGAPNLAVIEARAFGEPILARLEQVRQLVAEGRWIEATSILGPLRPVLRRVDPRLAERLTRVLLAPLVHEATDLSYSDARKLVGNFTRVAEPLPIDPRWNRLWALIWEGPQGDVDEAERHWKAYLADLETMPRLSAEERAQAQALVWKHLGDQWADDAEPVPDDLFGGGPSRRDIEHARARTIECLEESLRLDPRNRSTYELMLAVYQEWDQPDRAEAAARRLLEAFPDHLEGLLFLTRHHYRREEADRALAYVLRARALKPLDESIRHLEWSVRVGLASQFAREGRWDEGRAEFAAAEALWPEESSRFRFLARESAFELKAGQDDRAEEFIRQAQGSLPEPTPLWLSLLIESARYGLPKPAHDRFEHLWQAGLAKKGKSETAGALADILGSYIAEGVAYTGKAGHIKEVLAYLKRNSRIRYRREDLALVCAFLGQHRKETALLEKLAKRGMKNFPEAPVFYVVVAGLELAKGPFRANLGQARKHLEKALAMAQASGDPNDAAMVARIKEDLSTLEDATSGPLGIPFSGPGGMGGLPRELLDALEGLDFDGFDDFEDDDDEDDRPFSGRPPGALPRPRGPGRPGPRRKKR
jgi:tetratricopeptide (TPR) repeat protein